MQNIVSNRQIGIPYTAIGLGDTGQAAEGEGK